MSGLYIGRRSGQVGQPDHERPIVDLDGIRVIASAVALNMFDAAGIASGVNAIVPTVDGTGTAVVPDRGLLNICTVTPSNADHWIVLPTPTPGSIVVLLGQNSTGYEIRSNAPATVAINGGSGATAESAIAGSLVVIMFCVSATNWRGITLAAAAVSYVEAAA